MKKLNVLYQTNNNYACITGVSMLSLLENNKNIEITVYMLDDGIKQDNIDRLKNIAEKYDRKLVFLDTKDVNRRIVELGLVPYKNTYTTYYKLFIMSEFDIYLDRVLQLDGDTIINGNLEHLCDLDFGECVIAASGEPSMLKEYKKCIGIGNSEKYYNCGVLLFSLKNWKKYNCEKTITDHLTNERNKYFIVDQDILNVLFRKQFYTLSATYNFVPGFYLYGLEGMYKLYELNENNYFDINEIKQIMKSPIINHCMGSFTGRPWTKNNIHPQNDLYNKYLSMSPWKDIPKIDVKMNMMFKLQRLCYKILPKSLYLEVHRYILKTWLKKMDNMVINTKK